VNLASDDRLFIFWDGSFTFDPTTATSVEMEVASPLGVETRHQMVWLEDAVPSGKNWTRKARTVSRFCGSQAVAGVDDTALGAGNYTSKIIVEVSDGQIVTGPTSPLVIQ
jgi:hypothetical protein